MYDVRNTRTVSAYIALLFNFYRLRFIDLITFILKSCRRVKQSEMTKQRSIIYFGAARWSWESISSSPVITQHPTAKSPTVLVA